MFALQVGNEFIPIDKLDSLIKGYVLKIMILEEKINQLKKKNFTKESLFYIQPIVEFKKIDQVPNNGLQFDFNWNKALYHNTNKLCLK